MSQRSNGGLGWYHSSRHANVTLSFLMQLIPRKLLCIGAPPLEYAVNNVCFCWMTDECISIEVIGTLIEYTVNAALFCWMDVTESHFFWSEEWVVCMVNEVYSSVCQKRNDFRKIFLRVYFLNMAIPKLCPTHHSSQVRCIVVFLSFLWGKQPKLITDCSHFFKQSNIKFRQLDDVLPLPFSRVSHSLSMLFCMRVFLMLSMQSFFPFNISLVAS